MPTKIVDLREDKVMARQLVDIAKRKLFIEPKEGGSFHNKAYFLDSALDWKLGRCENDFQILIPLERDKD